MAEEPDIINSDSPSLMNLSFGKNVFSFYDQNETGLRAGIEVWNDALTVKYGTYRTSPNELGYYFFDIQRLLQNQTIPNYSAETYSNFFFTANDESFEFKIKYGWVNDAGVFQQQGTYPSVTRDENCVVLGGRKEYWDLRWNDQTEYITRGAGLVGCPIIGRYQKALTDYNITKPISELTGGVPNHYISGTTIDEVVQMYKRVDDELVFSFLTKFEDNPSFPLPAGCDGIKGVRISFYNGDTLLLDDEIPNIENNGGGPTNIITQDRTWVYPYNAISFPTGPRNFDDEYGSGFTHYYVSTLTYKGASCSDNVGEFNRKPTSVIYRVDIVDDACNDFAPVQVSWLNSLGFRDYFYFSKRTDESISISKNDFEKVEGTWSSDRFTVPRYSRGNTTFSQELTQDKVMTTKYLSDEEAAWLKNLYISPDVRVRYDGSTEWIPITITDNQWTERTFRKDKLFQYQIRYKEAHKINSQRG